ncbi:hypothetical protein [Pseudonocardia yunnanensis]|uniref:Uncharacterized protein n=1 Tax=Pseudonocardia yunnanensis TaxID=58107 RepID=A0ABW4F5B8_9PSEU
MRLDVHEDRDGVVATREEAEWPLVRTTIACSTSRRSAAAQARGEAPRWVRQTTWPFIA